MRVEDKGSSFVIDWRSKYLKECSEFIADQSTFSEDDKDLSEDNRDKVTQWASKWRKEGVISTEEEDCNYEEEQVNSAFFKAFTIKRDKALKVKQKVDRKCKPKINFCHRL